MTPSKSHGAKWDIGIMFPGLHGTAFVINLGIRKQNENKAAPSPLRNSLPVSFLQLQPPMPAPWPSMLPGKVTAAHIKEEQSPFPGNRPVSIPEWEVKLIKVLYVP